MSNREDVSVDAIKLRTLLLSVGESLMESHSNKNESLLYRWKKCSTTSTLDDDDDTVLAVLSPHEVITVETMLSVHE